VENEKESLHATPGLVCQLIEKTNTTAPSKGCE